MMSNVLPRFFRLTVYSDSNRTKPSKPHLYIQSYRLHKSMLCRDVLILMQYNQHEVNHLLIVLSTTQQVWAVYSETCCNLYDVICLQICTQANTMLWSSYQVFHQSRRFYNSPKNTFYPAKWFSRNVINKHYNLYAVTQIFQHWKYIYLRFWSQFMIM